MCEQSKRFSYYRRHMLHYISFIDDTHKIYEINVSNPIHFTDIFGCDPNLLARLETMSCTWHMPFCCRTHPDNKDRGANMGPIWGRHDPAGPHVGPMNLAIWAIMNKSWGSSQYSDADLTISIIKIRSDHRPIFIVESYTRKDGLYFEKAQFCLYRFSCQPRDVFCETEP